MIASFGGGGREGGKLTGHKLTGQALLAMLERRPCTADDVRAAFAAPVEEVGRRLAALMASGRVQEQRVGDVTYYLASR